MAKLMIKLKVSDITTSKLGENIMIQCENDIDIILTQGAINELIKDYETIKLKQL